MWMSTEQRSCFVELVQAAHPGTLSIADGFIVELGAVLLAQLRGDPDLSAAKMSRLHAVLGSLGLTPADRSKISAAKSRADGPAPFDF